VHSGAIPSATPRAKLFAVTAEEISCGDGWRNIEIKDQLEYVCNRFRVAGQALI
jgi:hypothetical protein